MVEGGTDLELKATGSNAVKFFTNSVERCKVTSAGNIQFGSGLGLNLTKSLGDAGNTIPAIWGSNNATVSLDYTGIRSGKIPFSIQYQPTGVTNQFIVLIDVGSILTVNSLVVWGVVHEDGHCAPYTWSRSFHFNYGTGIMKFVIGAGGTDNLSSNQAVSGSINYTIL